MAMATYFRKAAIATGAAQLRMPFPSASPFASVRCLAAAEGGKQQGLDGGWSSAGVPEASGSNSGHHQASVATSLHGNHRYQRSPPKAYLSNVQISNTHSTCLNGSPQVQVPNDGTLHPNANRRPHGDLPLEALLPRDAVAGGGAGGDASKLKPPVARMKDVLSAKTKVNESILPYLTCTTDEVVINAVRKMSNSNIGSLVVLDPANGKANQVAGIFTERDVLTKIVVLGRSPDTTVVGEVMTSKALLITSTPEANVYECMRLMTDNRIRHLPIVSGPEKDLVGIVSLRDVVEAVVREKEQEQLHMHEYISGTY